jgi:tetratricopeptide (TPR) repeat protein
VGERQLTRFGWLLRERGWPYGRFARESRKLADALCLDDPTPQRKQFDRWRYGNIKGLPRAEACEVLERMFPGVTAQELFTLVDSAPLPTVVNEPEKAEEPRHASQTVEVLGEEDDMRRRTLLRGLVIGSGLGVSEGALDVLAAARQRMDSTLETSTVGQATLERWESTVFEYPHAYQVAPPQQLLGDVVADFIELRELLEQRQPIRYRRRLCRSAGQMAALAGIFMSALGAHREARGWFHTGRLAAAEAGDAQLEAALAVRSAIVSLYYGSPASAYDQAARARNALGNSKCPAASRALVVEARALARMGRGDEALPLLKQAEATFSFLTYEERSDPALGYTERQLLFHVGNAYTHLGSTEEAWQAQWLALDMYPQDEHLDPTLIRMDRATCLARSGEPEEAYRVASDAITSLPDEHRTGMVMKYAADFHRVAGRADVPARTQFAELLRA